MRIPVDPEPVRGHVEVDSEEAIVLGEPRHSVEEVEIPAVARLGLRIEQKRPIEQAAASESVSALGVDALVGSARGALCAARGVGTGDDAPG